MTEIVVDEGSIMWVLRQQEGYGVAFLCGVCVQIKSHKEWSMFLEIFWL
jgi:hypothetical protein